MRKKQRGSGRHHKAEQTNQLAPLPDPDYAPMDEGDFADLMQDLEALPPPKALTPAGITSELLPTLDLHNLDPLFELPPLPKRVWVPCRLLAWWREREANVLLEQIRDLRRPAPPLP